MTRSAPQVPIEVDCQTGIWLTDGMPMIYLPRHFYVNHHEALERAFGREALRKVLHEAGYKSAWEWCAKESRVHGLRGLDIFRHYLSRLSLRGWGQFALHELDEQSGAARIGLTHSIYVEHYGQKSGTTLCYPFTSWFVGALEWAGNDLQRAWKLTAQEVECAEQQGHDHCVFEVAPVSS
ncbi:DUF5943 domain-containing protein [Pseudochelatococcus sp. B33]